MVGWTFFLPRASNLMPIILKPTVTLRPQNPSDSSGQPAAPSGEAGDGFCVSFTSNQTRRESAFTNCFDAGALVERKNC